MAKDEKLSKEDKKAKKKGSKLLGILMGIVVVAGISAVLYFNRQHIAPLVVDIPVLNTLFPITLEEDPDANITTEQLIEENKILQDKVNVLEMQSIQNEEQMKALEEKIDALSRYEEQYLAFEAQKSEWDRDIAEANPELFVEQYELMNPELAQTLYQDLVIVENMTKEQQEHARVIGEMDAEQAARALESLVTTDPSLVKTIFKAMALDRQSTILSEMATEYAAQVIKLISP